MPAHCGAYVLSVLYNSFINPVFLVKSVCVVVFCIAKVNATFLIVLYR